MAKKLEDYTDSNAQILDRLGTLASRLPNLSFGELLFHFATPDDCITLGDLRNLSNQIYLDTLDKHLHKKGRKVTE